MSWKEEPYKSAKNIANSKIDALILINLIGQVKNIGLTNLPNNELIKNIE